MCVCVFVKLHITAQSGPVILVIRLRRAEIRRFRPRGGHQNSAFRGWDYMIPYVVGKLAPNSSYFTKGLVKHVPDRGYFRAIPSQNGDKYVISSPPPIVELVATRIDPPKGGSMSVCMCLCVCIFIKLHITAQSGPVILVIICHSLITKTSDQTRQRGHTLSTCTNLT